MRRPVVTLLADFVGGEPAGADGFIRMPVEDRDWIGLAMGCAAGHQDLLSLWTDGERVHMALAAPAAGVRAIVAVPVKRGGNYPSVTKNHLPALRLERALRDLHGLEPQGLADTRPWLDHGRWPEPPPGLRKAAPRAAPGYQFLPAEGEGLHQVPVGPVHASIIEPGHFRFTANGEAVVRLEERLGYLHKGIAALARGQEVARVAKLAARLSGDATVAYSLAFALAVEAICGAKVPPRARLLRGIMAELERLAHHVNDVGAVCNDASVVVLHACCTLIREDILNTAAIAFDHRLMMDQVVPGGVARDLSEQGRAAIEALLARIETGFEQVVHVYDESPSLQDRTVTTGIVTAELARRFAAGGHVGRASGRASDTRKLFPYAPYEDLDFTPALRTAGDVDARVWVRIEEVRSSLSLLRQMLRELRPGQIADEALTLGAGEAASMVESFRGDVLLVLRLDGEGRVALFHARDPSWFQWPLLEAAIQGNIVADFPICNKSFNCAYAGHDL